MTQQPLQETISRLDALGWASCSPDPAQPCWHHPYADLNDPFTTSQALEYSARREGRMRKCAVGDGPDWAGYADEYDEQLSTSERVTQAIAATEAQGFPFVPVVGIPPTATGGLE